MAYIAGGQVSESDLAKSKDELIAELTELRKLVPRLEQLSTEHRSSERLQAALYAIADLASSAEDMDAFYEMLHHIVGGLMYSANFYIAFYDAAEEVVTFPYFVDSVDNIKPNNLPLEKIKRGVTAYILRTGKGLLASLSDIEALTQAGELELLGTPPVWWLGVPLIGGNEVTGAIVVQSYSEEFGFTEKDKELLTFVAQHIATALERKQALDELERRVARRTAELQREVGERKRAEELQAALYRLAELTNSATNMSEFYTKVHAIVGELLNAQNFYISLYDEDRSSLLFPYTRDKYDEPPNSRTPGRGLTEYVLRKAEPVMLNRGKMEELTGSGDLEIQGELPTYWLGVPLIYRGEVLGMMAVQSYKDDKGFRDGDDELLTFVSHHIATALERKRANDALKAAHAQLEKRVEERTAELFEANRVLEHQIEERKRIEQRLIHDALHDALTGLPNRNLFMDRLVQAMKRMKRNPDYLFAVLFLDLDRFKIINDSLGHMVGDELLKDVSRRVLGCMRQSDTVARLGGDEFAILMEGINGHEEVETIARRIRERLDEPFNLDNRQVFTSTSIGITLGHSRYANPEDLLRDADAAMYRAKEGGRNRFAVFDESMHAQAMAILEMQNDLHRAVERDEFQVHYQPVIDANNGRIIAFEALARWMHPEKGLIMPGEFIPLAEETDLIMALDWRIIHNAATQLATWLRQLPDFRPLAVSINISSKHFARPDFAQNLAVVLQAARLPPQFLKLEVREGSLMDNLASVNQVLEDLEKMKVRLLLDDFGTRYSSLSNLHRIPMEVLKIDRTFIGNMLEVPENMAIVRTIKALAKTLDMYVVAEGIENEALFDKARELGCEYLQGFYISAPLSSGRATEMLVEGGIVRAPKS